MPSPYDDDPAFPLHHGGKIEIRPTIRVRDLAGLALAYTPGVGRVSSAIAADPTLADDFTWRSNTVAIVTDGSAVLGLGDLGPLAALPVMEGKSLLFKEFGGVDAVPICLDCRDVEEIIETVVRLAPSFGGINLEDISAPRCFEIERRLDEALDIPVFHDDQHGTAVVVLAALSNAAKLTGRSLSDLRAVVSGAGAAGVAVTKILLGAGIGDIAVCDSRGVLVPGRSHLNDEKVELAAITNRAGTSGAMADAMEDADVYIGVSAGLVPEDIVSTMAKDCLIFSLANPEPEIHPAVARKYARVVATGRSDFPNQVNNVLAFPGIFKGALAVHSTAITERMKLAAADALAASVGDNLHEDHVIPTVFNPWVALSIAQAVSRAAIEDGVARRPLPIP